MSRPLLGQDFSIWQNEQRLSAAIASEFGWGILRGAVPDESIEDTDMVYVAGSTLSATPMSVDAVFDDANARVSYGADDRFLIAVQSNKAADRAEWICGNLASLAPTVAVSRNELIRETDTLQPMGPTSTLGRSFWTQARLLGSFDIQRSDFPWASTTTTIPGDFGSLDTNQAGLMVAWVFETFTGSQDITLNIQSLTEPSASVTTVTVDSGGVGYASHPTVSFSGGGGSGATATAFQSGGVLQSVSVTNGGSGYTSAPTATLSGGNPTTAATITANIGTLTSTRSTIAKYQQTISSSSNRAGIITADVLSGERSQRYGALMTIASGGTSTDAFKGYIWASRYKTGFEEMT